MARRVMEPRISIITLGVDDLERALKFYRDGLGFRTKGIIGAEFPQTKDHAAGATVVFALRDNLLLSLYPRSELAKDSRTSLGKSSATEFSVGQLVDSKKAVDSIIAAAAAAGATITDAPQERPWGIYSGYFQDPDGHLWEIIWNPSMTG